MALSCIVLPQTSEVTRSPFLVSRKIRLARSALRTPSRRSNAAPEAARIVASAPLAAVSIAAAGVFIPLDAAMAAIHVAPPAAVEQAFGAEALVQPGFTLAQAPALSLLADASDADTSLTPEERAKQAIAEFKRRKAEAEAAKAAAAAAAAQEQEAARAEATRQQQPTPSPQTTAVQADKGKSTPAVPAPAPLGQKVKTHGTIPAFVAQFGILVAYSGVVAATFLIPETQWKLVNEKLAVAGEQVLPILDDAWAKAKPVVQQAQEKGGELLVQAKPYAIKAVEAAKPAVASAIEQAQPLVAKAQEAVVSKVQETLKKKDA